MSVRFLQLLVAVATLAAVVGTVGPAAAAPPKVTSLYPAGAARGQTVTITATGDWSAWPVRAWVDRPGVAVSCENDKGKLRVAVAPDAAPGVYWIRLHDDEDAAPPRPLIVGVLPEVEEVEPNDSPTKVQRIEGSVTVNGKLGKAGDVDSFALSLRMGQTLVASVDAHARLGSPMDTILQVARLEGYGEGDAAAAGPLPRRVEAFVLEQRDDEVGLDPRLFFTAPRDGWYLVRLFAFPVEPNSSIAFAGGDNYIYRLTLTTGPFVDFALPLAVAKAQPGELRLFGSNLTDNLAKFAVAAPNPDTAALAPSEMDPVPVAPPEAAGGITLPWTDAPSIVAADDCSIRRPQPVPLPTTVSGRLAAPRDHDVFQVTVKKDQKIVARVESRELGFPLDPFVQVLDAAGKVIAEGDDSNNQRDVDLTWTAPADGEYRVLVRDVHLQGGPRYVYRLTLAEVRADYALTLPAHSYVLSAGKPLEIPITIDRRAGFSQPIEVRVEGLPAGVSAEPVTSAEKGDSAKAVKLILNADPASITAVLGQPIRIVGVATQPVETRRTATFAVTAPAATLRLGWLTVRK